MTDWIDHYLAADKRDRKEARSFTPRAARLARQRLRQPKRDRFTKYGITSEQYDALLVAQGGVCAICGKVPTVRQLCIDHDHETGEVRALLCSPCNLTLGQSRDPEWFRSAADYLERHTKRP